MLHGERVSVLEQNPSKQGLKLWIPGIGNRLENVLEQNPPKQGLKQVTHCLKFGNFDCFRAKSIKTRIETWRTDQIPNSRPDSYKEIC